MTKYTPAGATGPLPSRRVTSYLADDEPVSLRIAREGLRSNPPVVKFVARGETAMQRLLFR